MIERLTAIDSHTAGEPTRVIIDGIPDLGSGTMAERRHRLASEFDWVRRCAILEPRGSDVIVGAVLVPPVDANHLAGVIFFNNAGYLHMCGHGTIGVAATLAHLGRIGVGSYVLETPVGLVRFDYHGHNRVSIENVISYRYLTDVTLNVPGYGNVSGDVAWGGNWFFLVHKHCEELTISNINRLLDLTNRIRDQLNVQNIKGSDGGEIDHIELIGPPKNPTNHGRSFVLCPGRAYDRSPCGTGTSAKLACLAADGELAEGQVWRQESIIGSVFEASYKKCGNGIRPRITGEAFITAEVTLILDPRDPFRHGI
jgi:4-hydroxyproline epimerase